MIECGLEPVLECSSRGDSRFSAFYANIRGRGDRTIEQIYQAAKVLEDGRTNLSINEAKGKRAVNQDEVAALYETLWDEYFLENPDLLKVIRKYRGFSDVFGKLPGQCQAVSIYRIWVADAVRNAKRNMTIYDNLIVNKHHKVPYDVYCGRGSKWGNPYSHKDVKDAIKVDSVEEAVAQYRADVIIQLGDSDYRQAIRELRGKRLACYCKGNHLCHVSVLAGLANGDFLL